MEKIKQRFISTGVQYYMFDCIQFCKIFAPSNTAFNKLKTSVAALKNDTNLLTEILKYHVVNGIYKVNDLHVNELMLDSLSGTKIRINYYFTARVSICTMG
jgi:uncharacterized surface protein with fasciclin (FAS1) repeats